MFEKEKRKGVPTRGLLYLIAGVAIGVVGMMIVTLVLNVGPQPEPTSLPFIPTPDPGVTGTAAAQSVQTVASEPYLYTFEVDEVNDQIALSYNPGEGNVLQVRSWRSEAVAAVPEVTLIKDNQSYIYTQLSFNTQVRPATLLASFGDGTPTTHIDIYDTPPSSETVMRAIDQMFNGSYSSDGIWLAAVHRDTRDVRISRTPPGYFETVPHSGRATAIAFSPDSTMLAVVSLDDAHYHRWHVQVFRLPAAAPVEDNISLTPVKSYIFEEDHISRIAFSPDNTHIALGIEDSIRIVSVVDDEQRHFDAGGMISQLAYDATGEWLATAGTGAAEMVVSLYPLDESVPLPPILSMTQTIRMKDKVVDLQFVQEGLLVGEAPGNITLYRLKNDLWSEPIVVMENFE